MMIIRPICSVIAILLGGASARVDAQDAKSGLEPFLAKHCSACHTGERAKAKVRFDGPNVERSTWAKVRRQIAADTMPPDAKPRPTPEETASALAGIETRLDDCGKTPVPPTVIRRLNGSQYRNTVRDLLAIDRDPTVSLPADDSVSGFDNIAAALRVSPSLMNHYLRMARESAAAAIVVDKNEIAPVVGEINYRALRVGKVGRPTHPPKYYGERLIKPLAFDFEIPADDDYVLRMQMFVEQLRDQAASLIVEQEGKKIARIKADATELTWFNQPLKLSAGKHSLRFRMDVPDVDPKKKVVDPNAPVIGVEWLQIVRPSALDANAYPASHRKIMTATPSATRPPREAARAILAPLADRAFRRPATPAQVDSLLRVFDAATADGASFEEAIRQSIEALLCSPNFLFLVERAAPGAPLDDFELASRLSYFLWNTMPDDALLRAAADQTVRSRLAEHVDRMIADPRFEQFSERFVTQWLHLDRLITFQPDPANREMAFVDDAVKRAMVRETTLFFAAVVRENRPLTQLIDGDFTYVNRKLLTDVYGAAVPAEHAETLKKNPSAMVRASKLNQRGGILTHASVLMATSHPTRTSPVLRGAWILEALLDSPPPAPPPNIPGLDETAKTNPDELLTTRARLERHRQDRACASCHDRIDPLGFALENYNVIGRFQTHEILPLPDKKTKRVPIDASAVLPGGEKIQGVEGLKKTLTTTRKSDFHRAVAARLATYALGRGVDGDDCFVREMLRAIESDGSRTGDLIRRIAMHPALTSR